MRSTKARASRNCSGSARCVRSPERTTRLGRRSATSSSTPPASRGRWGGPKWTSEIWRIVRTEEPAAPGPRPEAAPEPERPGELIDLLSDQRADVLGDLGGGEAGDGGEDGRPVAAAEQEPAERRERHGRQRILAHDPLPVEVLGHQLVEEIVHRGFELR